MAYVTRKSVDTATRVGRAFQAIGDTGKTVIDMKNNQETMRLRREEAARNAQMFQQQYDNALQQHKENQQKMYTYATNEVGSILFNMAIADDPKSAYVLSKDRLMNLSQYGGFNFDEKQTLDMVEAMHNDPTIVDNMRAYTNAIGNLSKIKMSDKEAQATYVTARNALQKLQTKLPAMFSSTLNVKADNLDQWSQKNMAVRSAAAISETKATATGDAKTTARVDTAIDYITGAKGAATPIGKALSKLQVSGDLQTNLKGIQEGRIIPNDQIETQIATQLGQLESGGQRMAWDMVKHFMTKNAFKSIKGLLQYISSKPESQITKDFLKQYQEISNRQDAYYKEEVRKSIKAQRSKLSDAGPDQLDRFDQAVRDAHPWLSEETSTSGNSFTAGGQTFNIK